MLVPKGHFAGIECGIVVLCRCLNRVMFGPIALDYYTSTTFAATRPTCYLSQQLERALATPKIM